MNTSDTLFVGLNGHVIAFSKRDGTQLWKTKLKGRFQVVEANFVTVLADGEQVYVHTLGHLFCLDADTGKQLWTNKLAGLGYDVATLAVVGMSSSSQAAPLEQKRRAGEDSGAAVM